MTEDFDHHIDDTSQIITPALIVFRDRLLANLQTMLQIAGDPSRLRPHCKTHKTREVTQLQLELGITKHKAATFAEAEMLADAGAPDIFLAYNLVGPNIARAVEFVGRFPDVDFSVTADCREPIANLGIAMAATNRTIGVLIDLDVGQHRTGLPPGDEAAALYQQVAATAGLKAAGLHVYDGHHHQAEREERAAAVHAEWKHVRSFVDRLRADGLDVPRIVCGGTGSFPVYAAMPDPEIECSPGTCVLHDVGYAGEFPDLKFEHAAAILTRVISRPTDDRVTLDLGYKAVASDPPAGQRVWFPKLPNAVHVLQNEEHLVLQTDRASEFRPGDALFAIPRHICPTSALHREIQVVDDGNVTESWAVVARDRKLTI